jgi:hypothetical protein
MNIGLAFWVIWLIWVVFQFAVGGGYVHEYAIIGSTLLYAVLFGLLGWKVFGAAVHA